MYAFTLVVYSPKNTIGLDKGDYMAMTFQKHHLDPEETGIESMEELFEDVEYKAQINGHQIVDRIAFNEKVPYGNLNWHEDEFQYKGPEDLVKRLQTDADNRPAWMNLSLIHI